MEELLAAFAAFGAALDPQLRVAYLGLEARWWGVEDTLLPDEMMTTRLAIMQCVAGAPIPGVRGQV